MELSSERPFDIPMQAMDFVVTVMYEQVLVQGKCVGGTPDAALIHQYVQHRNGEGRGVRIAVGHRRTHDSATTSTGGEGRG